MGGGGWLPGAGVKWRSVLRRASLSIINCAGEKFAATFEITNCSAFKKKIFLLCLHFIYFFFILFLFLLVGPSHSHTCQLK